MTIVNSRINFNESISWDWTNLYDSRLAMIGDKKTTNKDLVIQEIVTKITAVDKKTVFWITEDTFETDHSDIFSLIEYECIPSGEGEGSQAFEQKRMEFVQSYLKLLALLKGTSREQVVPLATYQKHLSGPLVGYVKNVERISDIEHKNWLIKQFNQLDNVRWQYIEEKGYVYSISGNTTVEKLMSLFIGVWSYWAMTSALDEAQQILVILDLPRELVDLQTETTLKKHTKNIVMELVELTYSITMSLILSSECLFPFPELSIRHNVFWKYNSLDFNWRDTHNRTFFPSSVISRWEQGDSAAAIWRDISSNQTYEITMKPADINLALEERISVQER